MPDIFKTVGDVSRHIGDDAFKRAMLEMELNMGVYDHTSASNIRAWMAEDDSRKASQKAIDEERAEKEYKARTLRAAEIQADAAVQSTSLARRAIAISLVSIAVSVAALLVAWLTG